MLALLAIGPLAWATRSQTRWGVSVEAVRNQMNGGPTTSQPWGELGSLWNLIPNPANEAEALRGLGGGITWSMDPNLCVELLPLFREDLIVNQNFLDCATVRASISRAFQSWASNNRFIEFVDVTDECEKRGINFYSENHRGPLPSFNYDVPRFHGGCPIAEIWVTLLPSRAADNDGDIAVATATPYEIVNTGGDFYFTNGMRPMFGASPRRILEIYAGKLSIGVNGTVGGVPMCWYLDSYFCSGFHQFKRNVKSPQTAKAVIEAVCWLVAIGAALFLVLIKFQALFACFGCVSAGKRNADIDGDGQLSMKERFIALMEEVGDWNPLGFAILVALVVCPLTTLYKIMLPCWDCADFEGAMLHEIGHFIGLGHPDNIPDNMQSDYSDLVLRNDGVISPNNTYNSILAAGGRVNASNCFTLWDSTFAGVPPGVADDELDLGQGGYLVRNSVMEAFTQHNPKPCLTPDDVEAITVLYPDCTSTSMSEVVCHKVNHNMGVVRVGVYIVFPLTIALITIMIFSSIVHCYQKDELENARKAQDKLLAKVEKLESRLSTLDPPGTKKSKKNKKAKRDAQYPEVEAVSTTADEP